MLIGRLLKRSDKLDRSLQSFILSLVRVLGAVLTILICADMLSIPTTSLVTLLGTLGLAVSLSLQDLVANVAGGVFLMTSRPFKTGDWIEADGYEGALIKIGLIHTVLQPIGNHQIFIPNGKLMQASIVNYTTSPVRRINLTIPIAYECSTKDARQVIYDAVCADERVKKTPEPFVRVWDLADSSVNIIVRAWVDTPDYWEVRSSLIENIKYALDEHGISIPFNQLTVSFANKKED
jgi:small conductance mechanosensitive channel